MKQEPRKLRAAILEILRVTQKTKKQFSESIGAQPAEVRQWTMKPPRTVPVKYQKRIMAAYGAACDDSGKVWRVGSGKRLKFTWKSFTHWRTRLIFMHRNRRGFPRIRRYNGEILRYKESGLPISTRNIEGFLISDSVDVLCRTLEAARDKGGENNYRRLFAVVEDFLNWSQGIIKDFKLEESKHIQDVHSVIKKSGIIEPTGRAKYIAMSQSVVYQTPAKPPNYAANSIIEKGSPRHNAHIEYLKTMAKKGDKAAIANLKQHNIEA
jgi:hypothetical protein